MANPAKNLTALLQKVSVIDDEEALNIANNALKKSKNNVEALHTRIVALIKLDRFADALRALEDNEKTLAGICSIEKAYTLYKTGKFTQAELLLQETDKRGLRHVAAQVAYRAEKFRTAMELYTELRSKKSLIEGEEIDLMVNIAATDAQLEWQHYDNQAKDNFDNILKDDTSFFEMSYNVACRCIARQDFKTASIFLKRARDLCEASDEMNEDEKKSEILPIMLQQAYVLMKLGNQKDAVDLHGLINATDIVESPTKVIAHNNFLVTAGYQNPFMAQRILGSTPNLAHIDRLFWYQANTLQRNKFVIDIEAQKYQGVARSTARIISKSISTASSHQYLLSVLNAAAHARNKSGRPGLKAIIPLLEKRPKDIGLILTVVQLCVLHNNLGQAISRLERFLKCLEESSMPADKDIRFSPGLVALQVTLYRLSGRKNSVKSSLSKAASYWRHKNQPVIPILRAAAISLLESSDPKDVASSNEIFKLICELSSNDQVALTGYIASHASVDFDKVSCKVDKLTPVSTLIAGVDTTALENDGVPLALLSSTQPSMKRKKEGERPVSKKRRLSKKRMPKNFEEGKKVDPERWLPLRDRSNYRPSGKKGKKKITDSTQAGIIRDHDNIEMRSTIGSVKSEKIATSKSKKKRGKK